MIIGLSINMSLFFAMYIDYEVLYNYEFWWLWWVYILGVNTVDFLMIAIFFINKDFLGLDMAKKWLINSTVKDKVNG